MAPYNNAPESGTRDARPTAGRGSGAGAPAGGALFVGLVALCALVISYNGIFRFAEYGGHEGGFLAHLFPVAYTLLLVMACWVSYLLRDAHPRERFWVDLVLIPLLVLFAVAAMLLNNFRLIERMHQGVANVIVAVAPLAGLLVALLLWMALRAHTRRRRRRGPVARPRPADDPTTVLHARAVAPPARGSAPSGPRGEGEDAADRGWNWERDRWDDETVAAEPRPRLPREDAPGTGEAPEDATVPEAAPEAGADAVPETASGPEAGADAGMDEADGAESSVSAAPLPRRSRAEHNPIRRAAEQVPVVPGAAAPADPEPEPVVVVPDHLADEGFDHEPPPGDPASDEADSPTAEPEPAPGHVPPDADRDPATGWAPERESEPGTGREPEPEPRPGPKPGHVSAEGFGRTRDPQGPVEPGEPEPVPSARTWEEPGTGHDLPPEAPDGTDGTDGADGAEEPGTALWEPPEDDSDAGARVLSDYVPPVWTPPEDPPPPAEEDREPETTPVLDHDAGPEVRAALRIDGVPPGAARPSDEPAEPAPEPEETPVEPVGPAPEEADRSHEGEEPEVHGGPATERRAPQSPLEKRPMVLKPRRPPMTDFTSGPPSRRVRSEPLRPDE